jgi:branched-chain amino acid transport system ATP-binding protein
MNMSDIQSSVAGLAPSSAQPLLQFENISASYGPVRAVDGVNIDVMQGEIVTLIGANGAGKTTLMGSVFGTPRASGGRILHQGEDITRLSTSLVAKRGIAIVPEGRQIFLDMTVEENLLMGTTPIGDQHFEADRQMAFDLFPRLQERRNQAAGTMSGGEQQMLAIARALMSRPGLILLDEPSLGLAPLVVKQIFEVLKDIRSTGKTIFLVEQNAHHALRLSDRGYVLVNGRVRMQGSGESLLNDPEVAKAYLGVH